MNNWLSYWRQLSSRSRLAVVLGTSIIVLAAATSAWWITAPEYQMLFKNLSSTDSEQVLTDLDRWHIPYKLSGDGQTLTVPADTLARARMRLATDGLPSHQTVGFELFNQTDYGMTDFTQRVDYQRALQGELERTIMSLAEVKSARVHLTLKQKGLFLQSQDKPKGSVTLTLKSGHNLESSEISGIQRLIASAVDGLSAKDVVVLSDTGASLSGTGAMGGDITGVAERYSEEQQLETVLRSKIQALLTDAFGSRHFAVSVDVHLNFDQIKDVDQQVIPQGSDGNGVVTMKKETRSGLPSATTTSTSDGSRPGNNVASEIEYAHSISTKEVQYAPGRIKRISVGVLVPDTLTTDQIKRLRNVVAAAMGFDAARGDNIQLAAWHFNSKTAGTLPKASPVRSPADSQSVSIPASDTRQFPDIFKPVDLVGLGAALLLLLLVIYRVTAKRNAPAARLSAPQREAILNDLRSWLAEPADSAHE